MPEHVYFQRTEIAGSPAYKDAMSMFAVQRTEHGVNLVFGMYSLNADAQTEFASILRELLTEDMGTEQAVNETWSKQDAWRRDAWTALSAFYNEATRAAQGKKLIIEVSCDIPPLADATVNAFINSHASIVQRRNIVTGNPLLVRLCWSPLDHLSQLLPDVPQE